MLTVQPYVDGMGKEANEIMMKHPRTFVIPSPERALDNAILKDFQKRHVPNGIVCDSQTTQGMATTGGPAMY
jgi:hypothetical protein